MLYRYGLSSYAISEILWKKFGVKVSPRTICEWARKFGDVKHLLKHLNIKARLLLCMSLREEIYNPLSFV